MRNNYFKNNVSNDGITDYMVGIIEELIDRHNINKILDLGTGNGFLAKRIIDLLHNKQIRVTGIDISKDMIDDAIDTKYPDLQLLVMDNDKLKFEDGIFDLVMAKSVTNVYINEVSRVLKKGGFFIYKEYSYGKGMENIFNKAGINLQIGGLNIIKNLYNFGFEYIKIEFFKIPIFKTKAEIIKIIKTMHIADSQNSKKLITVLNQYPKDKLVKVISDPYLIVARK